MKFMGSKNRLSKHLLPLMLKDRNENQFWVEPFVGGGNMIDKVTGKRIGSDVDKFVIESLIDIRDNINHLPKNNKHFTEFDYEKTIRSKYSSNKGYVGFALSYGGKWNGGWRRGGDRDYVAEAYRNALKQSPLLQGVELIQASYDKLQIPEKSIIYCDPPYFGTTKYSKKQVPFNHEDFWEWCRKKHKEGHKIFISEYIAPSDFTCIFELKVFNSLTKDTGSKTGVEKLFTL